ncbi:asparagine synthase-related protein [Gammaproteobacteria bacterium]|nr:asparagine synthase-related protein [Gammaproteobacteria bacterium]
MTEFIFTKSSQSSQITSLASLCGSHIFGRKWTHNENGYELTVSCVDNARYWDPFYDSQTNTVFMIGGRNAFEDTVWREIDPDSKKRDLTGLVSRYLLTHYRNNLDKLAHENNGACVILIWEISNNQLTLITDRLGAFPVFYFENNFLHVATNADDIADTCQLTQLDMGSMAEVLAFGTSVYPYTYYKDIKMLKSGMIYRWNLAQLDRQSSSRYWEPIYDPWTSMNDAIDNIEEAFRAAIRRRTGPYSGKVGTFLSGGADSRTILFGARIPNQLTSISFYDQEVRELEIAKQLSLRAGASHLLFRRDENSYFDRAEEDMRCVGGMWNIVDSHFSFCLEQIQRENFDTLLSGCYVDYMFKGLLLNREKVSFLGLDLGIEKCGPFQYWFYLWRKPISEQWSKIALARLRERLEGIQVPPRNNMDRLSIESKRLIPLACEPDWLFRGLAWRTLPWELLSSDTDIINAYLRTPVASKLNGSAFRKAVDRICVKARDIPNANNGLALNAPTSTMIMHTLKKQLFPKKPVMNSHQGINANFQELIKTSDTLNKQWQDKSIVAEKIISELLGYNPWSFPLEEWAQPSKVEQFYRIYSLSLWVRNRPVFN